MKFEDPEAQKTQFLGAKQQNRFGKQISVAKVPQQQGFFGKYTFILNQISLIKREKNVINLLGLEKHNISENDDVAGII